MWNPTKIDKEDWLVFELGPLQARVKRDPERKGRPFEIIELPTSLLLLEGTAKNPPEVLTEGRTAIDLDRLLRMLEASVRSLVRSKTGEIPIAH